jgi:hypothetical protein
MLPPGRDHPRRLQALAASEMSIDGTASGPWHPVVPTVRQLLLAGVVRDAEDLAWVYELPFSQGTKRRARDE